MLAILTALAATLFVLRAPAAWKRPQARPGWLTTGFGLLGFLTFGFVIPEPLLDSFLGGRNVIALVQTAAASAAFWYLRNGMLIHARNGVQARPWQLILVIGAQTAAFIAMPDHGDVNDPVAYIHQSLPTIAGWLFIIFYQSTILALSLDSLRILRGDRRLDALCFRAGHALTALAATSELIGVTIWHFVGHSNPASLVTFSVFQMLFYPGGMLIASAYLLIWGRKIARTAPWQFRQRYLQHLLTRRNIPARTRQRDGDDQLLAAYEMFVVVSNHLNIGDLVLTERQQRHVERIGSAIDAGFSETTTRVAQ